MPVRYLYGSSADAIASQEMGRDSARDQRFFQSIAAQRAAQQQLDSELYRQAAFQAQQQQQARQAAQVEAQQRRLWSKQQQDLELGLERVGAQRDLGLEKNRFLQDKLEQERYLRSQRMDDQRNLGQGRLDVMRDLGEGRLGLGYDQLDVRRNLGEGRLAHLAEKLELDREIAKDRNATQMDMLQKKIDYWSSRPTSAEARLELADAEREMEEQREANAVAQYKKLKSEQDLLRGTEAYLKEAPNLQKKSVSDRSSWYWWDNKDRYRREFADKLEDPKSPTNLRQFYPPGLPDDYTKKMSLEERINLATPQITTKIEDLDNELALLEEAGVTEFLNRPPRTITAPPSSGTNAPPPVAPPPSIAPARVIADAKAAIAAGKDPALVVRKAQEKFGVDLTPYLR